MNHMTPFAIVESQYECAEKNDLTLSLNFINVVMTYYLFFWLPALFCPFLFFVRVFNVLVLSSSAL